MNYTETVIKTIAGQAADIHTTFPARVVAYDAESHTATLQPLYKYQTASGEQFDYPQLLKVPVVRWRFAHKHYRVNQTTGAGGAGDSSHSHSVSDTETTETEEIKLILQKDDLVICSCSERSIDDIFSGTVHLPRSTRKFDLTDAFVMALI